MAHQVTVTINFYIVNAFIAIIECVRYRDCEEWFDHGHSESGIYPVNPDGGTPFQVILNAKWGH